MPTSLTATIPALPALLLGFWLMQTGNTFQGTILSIRGEIEGFTLAQIGAVGAGFWAGVIIGSLRAAGVIRRVGHIRTFAAFGAIAATAPLRAPSCDGSVRVDSGASAHRLLFRRHVHCRRELAECGRELGKQGTGSKHLRHDRIGGRRMRPASSAHDRSGGLQAVLHYRLHHFGGACADRFDPGRRARASGRGQPRPLSARLYRRLAFRGRGRIPEWSDHRRVLHARADLRRGPGSEHR